MNLNQYLESVRHGVENATALADDNTRDIAQRLAASIDDATRLALIEAISDATAEISTELAPGSVEVRLNGGQPQFVVTKPAEEVHIDPEEYAAAYAQTSVLPTSDFDRDRTEVMDGDDEPTARISFRVPASVKAKIDDAADEENLSANAWLLRTVLRALDLQVGAKRPGPGGPFGPGTFGPNGPFGPGGPLNPENLFGPGGLLEGRIPGFGGDTNSKGGRKANGRRMQGWAE